jgi:hypothetical protein
MRPGQRILAPCPRVELQFEGCKLQVYTDDSCLTADRGFHGYLGLSERPALCY